MSADNQPHPTHLRIFVVCVAFLLGLAAAGATLMLTGGPSDLQVFLIVVGTLVTIGAMYVAERVFRDRP